MKEKMSWIELLICYQILVTAVGYHGGYVCPGELYLNVMVRCTNTT